MFITIKDHYFNMDFPFEQIVKGNILVRTFDLSVDSDELKWHQDLKDRTTAGYWSCNVGRYAKQIGLSSSNSW